MGKSGKPGPEPAAPPAKPARQRRMGDRQRRFIAEYVVDFNGTQAAIRAGYARGSARTRAYCLLRQPAVAAAVREALEERRRSAIITADRVLQEYARIAFADLRRFTAWGPDGVELKPGAALSDDDSAAIAELSHQRGRGTRIKLHDKRRALDSIARHLGLFTPQPPAADLETRRAAAARARETLTRAIAALAAGEASAPEPAAPAEPESKP